MGFTFPWAINSNEMFSCVSHLAPSRQHVLLNHFHISTRAHRAGHATASGKKDVRSGFSYKSLEISYEMKLKGMPSAVTEAKCI